MCSVHDEVGHVCVGCVRGDALNVDIIVEFPAGLLSRRSRKLFLAPGLLMRAPKIRDARRACSGRLAVMTMSVARSVCVARSP